MALGPLAYMEAENDRFSGSWGPQMPLNAAEELGMEGVPKAKGKGQEERVTAGSCREESPCSGGLLGLVETMTESREAACIFPNAPSN